MGYSDESIEAMSRKVTQIEAERKVRSDKKYRLMLEVHTMVIVACAGAFCVFALYQSGKRNMRLMNDLAAYMDWDFGLLLGALAAAWIIRSIKLNKQFREDVAALIATGFESMSELPNDSYKSADEVKLKYPIEVFESLSEEEMRLANDEWDDTCINPTDRFARLNAMIVPFANHSVYSVYVELRYAEPIKDRALLSKVDDEINDALSEIMLPPEEMPAFKEAAREIVRKKMAEAFPYHYMEEICIATNRIE